MDISKLSRSRFSQTVIWGLIASLIIVVATALIGRATLNLKAALTSKPDVGIYVLLQDEGIIDAELLRETDDIRDYLVNTNSGPLYVKLQYKDGEWVVAEKETLHE